MPASNPPLCPCGCKRPARTAKGWAARGCALRAIPAAVRSARAKAYALANPEVFKAAGRKGNAAWRPRRWNDLLDGWAQSARDRGPSAALGEAYRRGYKTGYLAGERARKATEAA